MKYFIVDVKHIRGRVYRGVYTHYINYFQLYYNRGHESILITETWNFNET